MIRRNPIPLAVAVAWLQTIPCFGQTPPNVSSSVGLKSVGQTFNMAQSAAWLAKDRFCIGRWDGSITVFRPAKTPTEFGPVLVNVLATPARQGIQLVAPVPGGRLVASNDEASLALWNDPESDTAVATVLRYDNKYGVAVSAACADKYLVTGHSEGYILLWDVSDEAVTFRQAQSIRSPDPIKWQFQSWHIRGIAFWRPDVCVTGSEDGDICLVSVPELNVLARQRYNPAAQRGINAISVSDNVLAVVNCSVGPADKNFWTFELSEKHITPKASLNLVKDLKASQVFDFSVQLSRFQGRLYFVAGTQEGLVWLGHIEDFMPTADESMLLAKTGGPVVAVYPEPWMLLAVSDSINLLVIAPKPHAVHTKQPESKTPTKATDRGQSWRAVPSLSAGTSRRRAVRHTRRCR